MGSLGPGDRVTQVRRLEPTILGSSLYRLSEMVFPVFIEDVRYAVTTTDLAVDVNAQAQVRRSPSRGVRQEVAAAGLSWAALTLQNLTRSQVKRRIQS